MRWASKERKRKRVTAKRAMVMATRVRKASESLRMSLRLTMDCSWISVGMLRLVYFSLQGLCRCLDVSSWSFVLAHKAPCGSVR